jgi:DNA-binding Lrp family transcriptional regulator
MTIDRLDARLITTLRKLPRVGLLEIARQLEVARGTVQARLAKLEARGVITGYGPEVDPAAMGYPISAFMLVELAQGQLAEAVAVMEAIPELLEADAISGPQDLICRVVAEDTEHLQGVVNQLLATPSIRRCTSYIVLTRQVPPRTEPLIAAAARRGT